MFLFVHLVENEDVSCEYAKKIQEKIEEIEKKKDMGRTRKLCVVHVMAAEKHVDEKDTIMGELDFLKVYPKQQARQQAK